MKCPECGQWNRAFMPRCVQCGTILPREDAEELSWKGRIKDGEHGAQYYRMDENGESDATPDRRDLLAEEMADLKIRQSEGVMKMRRMHQERTQTSSEAPAMRVRMHRGSSDSFWVNTEQPVPHQRREVRNDPDHPLVRPALKDETSGFRDDRIRASYDPLWEQEAHSTRNQQHTSLGSAGKRKSYTMAYVPSRSRNMHRFLRILVILVLLMLVGMCAFFGYNYFADRAARHREENRPTVFASIKDDMAAHTILIPGIDGQEIYIRELHSTYVVADGFATVEVIDHTQYDEVTGLGETMLVTLTPFLKSSSGQQTALEVINYEIEIPLSPLTINTPDGLRTEVSSSMFTMQFTVRPGSKVTINGKDVSDTIDSEDGSLSYNATVQAIGDNVFTIVCKSQYCRENVTNLVLYREPQEIPLDLAADTYTSTDNQNMTVTVTTLPGATIDVLSPFSDLDITNLNTTGEFSFIAKFSEIGYNTIEITSSFPGKKTSHITYQVYYIPKADIYTRKAWGLSESEYAELIGNITFRANHHQVYAVMGVIDHLVSEKPQMAVIYTSTDGKNQPVLVQNFTSTDWEVGKYYRLYADVEGSYDSMPWLNARYTYKN